MASQMREASPSGSNKTAAGVSERERCTKYFDALWFCYSPVYQMKQFYIYGTVDDCREHWGRWFNCLKQRTRFADEEPRAAQQVKHPIWQLRTKEEAQEFWQQEFGHFSSEQGDEKDPLKAKRKTTFF